MPGDPYTGSRLFFEKKGCAHCHAVNGVGGKRAPELGYGGAPQAGINHLVSAMWNHAGGMWEQMRAEKVPYPDLRNEEMAHLFAFLYTAPYMDEEGDQLNGQSLFRKKGCIRCHSVRGSGGGAGPDLATVKAVSTPVCWTQAMWNHAPAMEKAARQMGVAWPAFENREMNDLLAYVRANSGLPRQKSEVLPADPGRGWQVFRSKSCLACHAVKGKGGHVGPELGPGRQLPLTVLQFGALMWNHSPEMSRAPEAKAPARPTFEGREIADLVAFLASLRNFEPAGSPYVGHTIFSELGCGRCHGAAAEGGSSGPALRGRGQPTTSVTLATAMWRHGPKMNQRARQMGRPWPGLPEDDVADIVAFLNSPVK